MAWAFATVCRHDAPLSAALVRAEGRLGDFNARDLTNTAWTSETTSQQNIASAAWASATTGLSDAPLFVALAR